MAISLTLRRRVHARAAGRCEYCQISEADDPLTFHIDHVVPAKHGGGPDFENLCLSCSQCNLHKGSDFSSIEPTTGDIVPLFNPRTCSWSDHFRWDGPMLVGLTPVGRATVRLLQVNAPERTQVRRSSMLEGRHPPR